MMNSAPRLSRVLHDYGEAWQIQYDPGTGVWTGDQRPTVASLHIVVGHSLADLEAKLAKAKGEESG
jgi:hypothetical protein